MGLEAGGGLAVRPQAVIVMRAIGRGYKAMNYSKLEKGTFKCGNNVGNDA